MRERARKKGIVFFALSNQQFCLFSAVFEACREIWLWPWSQLHCGRWIAFFFQLSLSLAAINASAHSCSETKLLVLFPSSPWVGLFVLYCQTFLCIFVFVRIYSQMICFTLQYVWFNCIYQMAKYSQQCQNICGLLKIIIKSNDQMCHFFKVNYLFAAVRHF